MPAWSPTREQAGIDTAGMCAEPCINNGGTTMPASTGLCATVTLTSMCQVERARVWAGHDIRPRSTPTRRARCKLSGAVSSWRLPTIVDVNVLHHLCPTDSTDAAPRLPALPSRPGSAPHVSATPTTRCCSALRIRPGRRREAGLTATMSQRRAAGLDGARPGACFAEMTPVKARARRDVRKGTGHEVR